MADLPILFSAPMVRALLREAQAPGTGKTQTRRAIPQAMQDAYDNYDDWCSNVSAGVPTSRQWEREFFLERIRIRLGDRLWCRETYTTTRHDKAVYRADARDQTGARWSSIAVGDPLREVKWRPSIFMSRRHSRLTLYVADVRVERLQDLSEEDARAEGIECDTDGWRDYQMPSTQCCADPVSSYRTLWDSINGPGSWDENPFVAAYTFAVRLGNIDTLPATLEEAR